MCLQFKYCGPASVLCSCFRQPDIETKLLSDCIGTFIFMQGSLAVKVQESVYLYTVQFHFHSGPSSRPAPPIYTNYNTDESWQNSFQNPKTVVDPRLSRLPTKLNSRTTTPGFRERKWKETEASRRRRNALKTLINHKNYFFYS